MTAPVEIVVNVVESGASGTSSADTLATAINNGQERFELVNSLGQVVAAAIGAIPILKPITIQANTLALTTTMLKLTIDIKEGKSIETGDVLNLVGNVAGIIGTVAFLAGAAPVIPLVAAGVSIATALTGVLTGDNVLAIQNWSADMFNDLWPSQPVSNLGLFHLASDGTFARYDDLLNNPYKTFGALEIKSNDPWGTSKIIEAEAPPRDADEQEVDGDGMY